MKAFFFLISIFQLVDSQAQSKNVFKEDVKKAHQTFIDAIISEDYRMVDAILEDKVTFGAPGGGFETKQSYVNALKNGTLLYDSFANHSFNVRIYGSAGVVNGKVDLAFRYKDENGDWFRMLEHLTFTTVYTKSAKDIKMTAWQSTRSTTDILEKTDGHLSILQGLKSSFLYSIEIDVDSVLDIGKTSFGSRKIFNALGGNFKGPKFSGKVLSSGGDYAFQLDPTTLKLEVRLVLQTDDGELIYNTYSGYIHSNSDGTTYWKVAFLYETASQKYNWLNHCVTIGVGRGVPGKAIYDVYMIE
jgi:hypothetical protein